MVNNEKKLSSLYLTTFNLIINQPIHLTWRIYLSIAFILSIRFWPPITLLAVIYNYFYYCLIYKVVIIEYFFNFLVLYRFLNLYDSFFYLRFNLIITELSQLHLINNTNIRKSFSDIGLSNISFLLSIFILHILIIKPLHIRVIDIMWDLST